MVNSVITPNTQVALLLTGRLGRSSDTGLLPLTTNEYNKLARRLAELSLQPEQLLDSQFAQRVLMDHEFPLDDDRVRSLLMRGTTLAIAVERWTNSGLWVIGRTDSSYPTLLRQRLGGATPPILFGTGNRQLLDNRGLAIVGSRNVDDDGLEFALKIARRSALEGIQVVSGAARGVDSAAMVSCLDAGGTSIGVVSDQLQRLSVSGTFREYLVDGSLVLVSPYDPDAGFHVGQAMGRNKLIYAMASWSMVISADLNKGGTWAGAVENLKAGWVPLFVRDGKTLPDGNRALVSKGGFPVSHQDIEEMNDLTTFLINAEVMQPELTAGQLPLFPR